MEGWIHVSFLYPTNEQAADFSSSMLEFLEEIHANSFAAQT